MTEEDKIYIAKLIRKEIGCGLMKAYVSFEELLEKVRSDINKPKVLEEQSAIPSNLDEAAQKVEDYYDVGEEHGRLCCHRGDIKDAFKAGAEWMAGQGEIFETEITNVGMLQLPKLNIQADDKVIVQIRKISGSKL